MGSGLNLDHSVCRDLSPLGVMVYDGEGQPLEIEILDASKVATLEEISVLGALKKAAALRDRGVSPVLRS